MLVDRGQPDLPLIVQADLLSQGRALDNIFIERPWRAVKCEEVYLPDYANPREARHGLGDYFLFYNERRPHQAPGYRTPAETFLPPTAVP